MHVSSLKPGFYWGLWLKADARTKDGKELTPALEWEVMHVVENCLDPNDPEWLKVQVPGVEKWQSIENFKWGDFVAHERPVR